MMRDCPDGELRDLLPLYAMGALAGADHARVEAHVASCADCRAELELVRRVARAYAVAPVNARAIVAHIPPHVPGPHAVRHGDAGVRPFYRQRLWQVAATVTLMIGAAAMLTVARSRPESDPPPANNTDGPAATLAGTGSSAAGAGTAAQVAATHAISLGVRLADLTDAQLDTLLSTLDTVDGNVLADPEILAQPIVPAGPDPD